MALTITDHHSPNFGDRRDGKTPRFLVLHYTDTLTAEAALRLMQDPAHEAAAHYLVDEGGGITRVVAEKDRAWHAGKAYWLGETDINSTSIGIEIQNPGHQFGYVPFAARQMEAVRELCADIMERHRILPQDVIGHSDIAPGRKIDPGELFPWEWLAEHNIGLFPHSGLSPRHGIEELLPLLHTFGYDPAAPAEVVIAAFQRHFEPDVFKTGHPGVPTEETLVRLENLLAQKI